MNVRIARRALRLVALCAFAAAAVGCAHVPAYARGRLAHRTMQADDTSGPAASHVYAVHEGATGGGLGASSGCGCN